MNPPTPQTLARYGMTEDEWRELLDRQGGVCGLCGKPARTNLVIDHDHKTGAVRGLLHPMCNGVLGKVKDNAEWCRQAADYLDQPPAAGNIGRGGRVRGRRRARRKR